MLKRLKVIFKKNKLWITSIFILNFIFGILLWLSNDKAFIYIFPTMIMGSLILYFAISFILYKKDLKRELAISNFLNEPTKEIENEIINLFNKEEAKVIKNIGEILRKNNETIKRQNQGIDEYKEYIEAWAHEIKTPLGLMTFILGSRREDLPDSVYKRLEYSREKMQDDIERMLYYARLKSARNDYFFRELSLKNICIDVVQEYEKSLQEYGINVILDIKDYNVVTDKKGVQFILKQIISNAIKYKNNECNNPHIKIYTKEDDKNIRLVVIDNGIGVKEYDLPFIFDKGFTGEIGEQRKNSTGIGLYLAKKVSEKLKIYLEVTESYKNGFEITLVFQKISN